MELVQEILQAFEEAQHRTASIHEDRYRESVQTRHSIVFNTRLVSLLRRIHSSEGQTFGDLRDREPRKFHELLGLHVGDAVLKDRIYGLSTARGLYPAYNLQAFVVSPVLRRIDMRSSEAGVKEALAQCGEAEVLLSVRAGYVEEIVSKFSDTNKTFGPVEYTAIARLRDGGVVMTDVRDHIVIATGHIGRGEAVVNRVPRRKSLYKGPFVYLSARGNWERRKEHLDVLQRSFSSLLF